MSKFKNYDPSQPYRCFLYKRENGEVKSKLVVGEDAAQKGLDDGWVMSPSGFVDDALPDAKDEEKDAIKIAADSMSNDMNVLVNADTIEDMSLLRSAYAQVAGKPLHHRVTTLKGARNACKKLLGDVNGDSADIH